MIGIEESDKNAYEWVANDNNKFRRALQISTRLSNDILTNEDEEITRGFTATASICYMKQCNVLRKEAIKAFQAMIAAAWEDVNEGCLRPTPVGMPIMRTGLDYQRMLDFAYKDNDDY
ncbi:hypothetical protein PTKIN_Ptkin07bG0242200 [Pterospermum kingtungense]